MMCERPVGLRLDRMEVANGKAMMFPLLLENHVQAREDGRYVIAHHRDATRTDVDHFGICRV